MAAEALLAPERPLKLERLAAYRAAEIGTDGERRATANGRRPGFKRGPAPIRT